MWILALAVLVGGTPSLPELTLDWGALQCPRKQQVRDALHTYGIVEKKDAAVVVTARTAGPSKMHIVVLARGTESLRDVELPRACADRAAALAVVIEALVAPFFWPEGKPQSASEATSQPTVSALDWLSPSAASMPASEPSSVPQASGMAPASEPVAASSLPVVIEPSEVSPARSIPMIVSVLGGLYIGFTEPLRGRFGLGFAAVIPAFVRWFAEVDFITLQGASYSSSGRAGGIVYGEGHAVVGADLSIYEGLFAGVGVGLQLVYAKASGFDSNRGVVLLSPSGEVRVGYRQVVLDRLELGLVAFARAELFRSRLLVDDVVVRTLLPAHVGAVLSVGVVF